MKLALGPRGMKLSLVAMLAIGVSLTTGCAGNAQSAAAPQSAVGTTTLTSATFAPSTRSRPSSLAPAAWDADESSPAAAAPAAPAAAPLPTWGTAVTSPTH